MFETEKKKYMEALYKPDKSKKGNVDEEISYLIDHINSLDDYYTTSSCAGRIVLIELPDDGKKNDANWLFTSHALVDKISIENIRFHDKPVWFKQESFILHVCAKTFEKANELLIKAHEVGFKRAGLIATSKRFIVEITGTEGITAPLHDGEKILVDQKYLDYLVFQGNNKLQAARDRVKRLYEKLK